MDESTCVDNGKEDVSVKETILETVKIERFCEPCLFDDENVKADGFCTDCADFLCTNCCRDHNRNKVTRGHNILNDELMPRDVAMIKKFKDLTKCQIHYDQEVTFHCKVHDAWICILCVTQDHRKCETVLAIDDSDPLNSDSGVETEIQKVHNALDSAMRSKEQDMNNFISEKEQAIIRCKLFEDETIKHIKTLSADLQNETRNQFDKAISKVSDDLSKCNEQKGKLDFCLKMFNTIRERGTKRALFMVTKVVLCELESIPSEKCLETAKDADQICVTRQLHLAEIPNLGRVDRVPKETESHKASDELRDDELLEVATAKCLVSTGIQTEDIMQDKQTGPQTQDNVSEKKSPQQPRGVSFLRRRIKRHGKIQTFDTYESKDWCTIKGILTLSDGRLAILDCANNMLKVETAEGYDIISRSLPDEPSDFCYIEPSSAIQPHCVCVCFPDSKTVVKYEINRVDIVECAQFRTRLHPLSVCAFGKQIVLLSSDETLGSTHDVDETLVEIRDTLNGSIKNSSIFVEDDDKWVRTATRICMKGSSQIVFACESQISCYDIDTDDYDFVQEKDWWYRGYQKNRLQNVKDVSTDSEGNVYVCGEDSENIHQISSSNYRDNSVILSNINQPISICVDNKHERIIVGHKDNQYVEIYYFD